MKQILQMVVVCIALASSSVASAFTAKDLDGKYYGAYMVGTDLEYELAKEQFGGKFELRDGTLYMVNFWRAFDMPVTVNESDNSISIPAGEVSENGNGLYPGASLSFSVSEQLTYGTYYYGYNSLDRSVKLWLRKHGDTQTGVDDKTTDNISGDCLYRFASDSYMTVTMNYQNQTLLADGNGMRVYVFDTNTNATEHSGGTTDKYRVDIQRDPTDPTKATVKNFAYWGINYLNSIDPTDRTELGWIDASIDYEKKTFTIAASYTGGDVLIPYDSYRGSGVLGGKYGNWYEYWGDPTLEHYIGCYLTDDSNNYILNDIIGNFDNYEVAHRNVEENYWHKNCGGKLETYEDCMDIEFGPMNIYSTTKGNIAESDRTIYEVNFGSEYTHDIRLEADLLNISTTHFYVGGKICEPVNNKYVESYDLFVVPGYHESIITLPGTDDVIGATGAVELVSGLTTDADGVADFIYDESFPDGLELDPYFRYTLFVRANYKPEYKLNPTFHSLTLGSDILTGIKAIEDGMNSVRIAAVSGGISVGGFDGTTEVYTASGMKVFGGVAGGVISVAPGFYIVRAGNTSAKVRVD